MYNFFNKFPVVFYNNNTSINLLARVKFTEAAKKINAIYYPYTIIEGERADIIAANYYDDPRYSWIIYLANDIVDPVYDWPLTEEEFKNFIIKKYGSTTVAAEKIIFWRVNWYEDDTMLTPAGYQALPSYAKKYFVPQEGPNGRIVAYVRSQLDLAAETNKVQQLTVSNTTNFSIGEQLTQKTSGVTTAAGFITNVINNTLTVNHITGIFANTGGSVGNVIGVSSSATSSLSAIATLATPIPTNEVVYWNYVSAYDYESELNESKRFIKLIDKSFVDQIEKELEDLL